MSKPTPATKAPTPTKAPAKAPPTPQMAGAAPVAAAPELLALTGAPSVAAQADRLGNARLAAIQRQLLADRVGQQQGNGHVQQVIAFAKQRQDSAPYQPNIVTSLTNKVNGNNNVHPHQPYRKPQVYSEDGSESDASTEAELGALWGEGGVSSLSAGEPPPNLNGIPGLVQKQADKEQVQDAPVKITPQPTGQATPAAEAQQPTAEAQPTSSIVQRDLFEDPVKVIKKDVADFAHNIPGYSLLTYVLGRDPISEEDVQRTPVNLVRAVLGLIPGGEQIFQNLQESGALQQAFDWLQEQLAELNLTWEMIKGLLTRAWNAIDITDALHPLDAFNQKIKPIFLPMLTRLKNFALAVGKKILEFVLAGAMKLAGPMGERIIAIFQQAGSAFDAIVKDPLTFLRHLWAGIKSGLGNFVQNIGVHLQSGFIGWLTGTVARMGIQLPPKWDLAGIFSFVMQVLNIDLGQILGRLGQMLGIDLNAFIGKAQQLIDIYQNEGGLQGLAKYGLTQIIGEEHMHSLMQVFQIFDILRNGEIGKLWTLIKEHLSSLKDLIFGQIKEFLIKQVVQEGIKWVLSLLDPTLVAQIVKLCQSIYRIVSFLIERAQQILPLVEAVTGSLAAVASGNIGAAASAIENALSRALPMAMGFLSSLLIGDITGPVQKILKEAQGMIQEGINAVLNSKPVKMVAGFISKALSKVTELAKTGFAKAKAWATDKYNQAKGALGFEVEENRDVEAPDANTADDYGKLEKNVRVQNETETHRLYFEKKEGSFVLMLASDPETYESFIDSIETGDDEQKLQAKQQAIAIAGVIRQLMQDQNIPHEEKTTLLNEKLTNLSIHTAILFESKPGPSSPPIWGPTTDAGFGTTMTIEYLTADGPRGQAPTRAVNSAFTILNLRRQGGRSYYVKGHLLSQKLHGPGGWENLTPLFQNSNQDHETFVENVLKKGIDQTPSKVFRYTVDVVYGRGVNEALIQQIRMSSDSPADKKTKEEIVKAEAHAPIALNLEAIELDPASRAEKPDGVKVSLGIVNRTDQSSPDVYDI